MPRGQSSRRSDARTSHRAPKPKVTTRHGARNAIHATFASSPFSTARPVAGSASIIFAFSERVTSSVGIAGWCSLPIDVTTVTSGRIIRA